MSGFWVVHDPPAEVVVAAVQPRNTQTVAPAGIVAVAVVQVAVGALPAEVPVMAQEQVAVPRLVFIWISVA